LSRNYRKYIPAIAVLAFASHVVFGFSPGITLPANRYSANDTIVSDTPAVRPAILRPPADSNGVVQDSLIPLPPFNPTGLPSDTLVQDSITRDTTARKPKTFLEERIDGKNRDSLIYDVRQKMVYIYGQGDVTYEDMNLKADFMEVSMDTKNIYAYGSTDTTGKKTRPEFVQGGTSYTMDTIKYNIDSKKAKIRGVASQEGDGFLLGREVKKMPDNSINILGGKYTTCDHIDHPHFFLAMNRGKVIPGKKIIVGRSYFVMEDVPIYFPLLPFGFFPITQGRSSGFIVPTFGEESVKGFFLRDGGYYFAINDYMDLTLLGGIYTLGSWSTSVSSRYIKKYRFTGDFNISYSKDITGDKGSDDYVNQSNFRLLWNHRQDPKFRPNSTFSASVQFSTSGYNKYSTTTMNDYLNTQTSSSIAYSKSWPGKPFSFNTSFSHSQNSRDSTISLTFPNVAFNVSNVFPFKRKEASGKERWYEKISFTYALGMQNTVTSKEKDLFTTKTLQNMRNGVSHKLPIKASFNILNYINLTPSANYNERWYFKRIEKMWDPQKKAVVAADTTYGFYRVYDYSFSGQLTTKIYGMFQMKNPDGFLKAVRHVITPSVSFSYTPDFSKLKYGYYRNVQTDSTGTIGYYSPYEGALYGVPGRGSSASINFSLTQNLEAKIRSNREADTTGMRKIKVIDNLSISSSYNLLADSLALAPFNVTLRTPIYEQYILDVSARFDPYQINDAGQKIGKYMIKKGSLARLTYFRTSFNFQFGNQSGGSGVPAMNDGTGGYIPPDANTPSFFDDPNLDPATRRQMMTSTYYDFSIPWNVNFNYVFEYNKPGNKATITQSIQVNASFNLTSANTWAISMNGFGYDFTTKQLTPGTVTIARDLHCWQMNLTWTPIGFHKSWSFHIGVKSGMLKDIKYDKQSSFYDNLYD
jgi:lipopolysaccharide assembly outer membrane protein LptD (OstA)